MTEASAIYKVEQGNVMESVVIGGDLSKLSPGERVMYYKAVCESIGLNPLTRPFEYITLNNKLTLYARKDATDQLRKIHQVSIDDVVIEEVGDTYSVKVKGHDATGRADVEIGVVSKRDMQGNSANVQMKAVTKAKRRLTLSLCGLGMLDETEIETIPSAVTVTVTETGEIEQPVLVQPETGMTFEQACDMTNSKNTRYGDMTDKDLAGYKIGLEKGLAGGDLDARKQDIYLRKLEAVNIIQKRRAEESAGA